MTETERKKKLGPYKRAVLEATERSGAVRTEEDGMVLYKYSGYEAYKDVQISGNKAKLRMQFVKESHIVILSDYITQNLGEVSFAICHGTRRGAEQAWFRDNLNDSANVIGTEISDTASQFANTVQWDFHETNPEWSNQADFIYSNSWDHAFEPEKAFLAWIDALRPGGLLLLDHSKGQSPDAANPLDPFGITFERLVQFFEERFGDYGELKDAIDTRKQNKEYRARVLVFEKSS